MFHVKHEAWVRDADRVGAVLSEEQCKALGAYRSLLSSVAIPRGMIAPGDEGRLWERHILDGLRGVPDIAGAAKVADLGSGAGVPGIPLAIAAPSSSFVLVEPRRGRVAFLEAVVDDLRLPNVRVFLGRAEDVDGSFDVCVARALAPLDRAWALAEPLLGGTGKLIYWAGESAEREEVDLQGVSWRVSTRSGLADGGPLVIMARQ
jgi:16S rRNA (guanine527-N7)-methyltransferase